MTIEDFTPKSLLSLGLSMEEINSITGAYSGRSFRGPRDLDPVKLVLGSREQMIHEAITAAMPTGDFANFTKAMLAINESVPVLVNYEEIVWHGDEQPGLFCNMWNTIKAKINLI